MRRTPARLLLGAFVLSALGIGLTAEPASALSPAVATSPASALAVTTATLNGKVNPNGSETKYFFEYGKTASYGSKTSEVSAGSGTATLEKSQPISGLSGNTLYHYRIVAKNAFGTSQGADQTFLTFGTPTIEAKDATVSASGTATLRAMVDPNGLATTYQFHYGTSELQLTKTVPIPAGSAGSGQEPVEVSYELTGLTPMTKYYFRATATNAAYAPGGGGQGPIRWFYPSKPTSLTSPAGSSAVAGTEFIAKNEGGIEIAAVEGGISIACSGSTFLGQFFENEETGNATGLLWKHDFTMCGTTTVETTDPGIIEFVPTGGGSGIVKSYEAVITVLTHNVFVGTSHCIYYTEGSTIGTVTGSKSTGATATLDTDESIIPQKATSPLCGKSAELRGSYTFTSPDYLDID